MFGHFSNEFFLIYRAQRLPSLILQRAYAEEEESFKKTVCLVPRSEVDSTTNIISSRRLYKAKADEDKLFELRARVAPYQNKDSLQYEFRSDCFVCAPMGARTIVSIAVGVCLKLMIRPHLYRLLPQSKAMVSFCHVNQRIDSDTFGFYLRSQKDWSTQVPDPEFSQTTCFSITDRVVLSMLPSCLAIDKMEITKLQLGKLLTIFWIQGGFMWLVNFSDKMISNSCLEQSFMDPGCFVILASV